MACKIFNLQHSGTYRIKTSMDNIKPYFRASKKQLDYLAFLCDELEFINRSLYEPYTMIRASKEISRLRKHLIKKREVNRQLVLL